MEYYCQLGLLYKNADKEDQPYIRDFYKKATELMDEMRKWHDDSD